MSGPHDVRPRAWLIKPPCGLGAECWAGCIQIRDTSEMAMTDGGGTMFGGRVGPRRKGVGRPADSDKNWQTVRSSD